MGKSKPPCLNRTVVFNPYVAVEVDSTGGFFIMGFDYSDQFGVDVVQPYGSPQCCMTYTV
ncbi:hypothetical protein DPMN_127160 [Dreissena polymorpha]|uniref:Uncharacterized protein n=1 Tax=Dreissena polymorpha TaxID=45954 RepID=A0A9D4GX62_DREPO|nr:hypothetical protein DPMN_127160 [Dreissena polymorpha]